VGRWIVQDRRRRCLLAFAAWIKGIAAVMQR
jgi:hypothetical protein